MKYKWIAIAVLLFSGAPGARAQKDQGYQSLRFVSSYTCFPDTGRAKGFLDGDSIFRPVAGHYDDSSVLMIVPPGLKRDRKTDLVFWFHGWHNNIDTALQFYGLARQFAASRRNAILVLAEAGRNVADSYGGKMNQKGEFGRLVGDVMEELKKYGIVPGDATPGRIILAGHSGAFGVMADILANGQTPVDEVFLFDALYGRLPIFMNWVRQDKRHHFIHWFTNHGGGTDEVSDTMMQQLESEHLDYLLTGEAILNPALIKNNRILFIHSSREHNVIINDPDDFRLLLENSSFLGPLPE
ncbi:MAG TPA: hypothetical protein VG052_11660 [Puia sp.]|jgi:hypothetical protein|nr:hypothetical protein [Puia sp.]